MSARRYCDLYTWSHPLTAHALAHTDGAVSVAVEWSGIDSEFATSAACNQAFSAIEKMLGALPRGHWLECHLWRRAAPEAAAPYRAHYAQATRPSAFGAAVRDALADHLAAQIFVNRVALVVGVLPPPRLRGIRRSLATQHERAVELEARVPALVQGLPHARLLAADDYVALIAESYGGSPRACRDPWLSLAEQLVTVPPELDDESLRVDGRVQRILYLQWYPDAQAGWVLPLVSAPVPLHISQIAVAADTEHTLRALERADRLAMGTIGHRGRERQMETLADMQAFRRLVAQRDLSIHRNAYVLVVPGEARYAPAVTRIVAALNTGGHVRADRFVQLPFFRAAQPGQGYRVPLWRPDHARQIAAMAPVQVFRTGAARAESLRLGMAGQPVFFDYSGQAVGHAFTVAMTGAGKGVDKVATIAETHPFGIDWYILEIGGTYRWVVEALGGTYTCLDPERSAVNPLPARAAAGPGLPPALASATLNVLAFLLTDGRTTLEFHEAAAAGQALGSLYAQPGATDPGLADLLAALQALTAVPRDQRRAAARMAGNLESFLSTPEGAIFAGPDNVVLSPGISGVDLKEIDRAGAKILTFYLVFICLRFLNLAFAQRTPARILLDEVHRFVAHAPDIMRRLVSEVARMGRKENASIDIVTQGLQEIDVMEEEIVNSMPLRSLLYRTDGWEEIAARIGMPAPALAIWKAFPYPLAMPWRPAVRSVGPDYFSVRLTFPQMLLDLADTTPQGLSAKARIGARSADPLERLRALRAAL
ncbi:MAG: hypothetical protein M0Z76_09890 [Gammaproteobacteria bacterium]|nr:hypothetical protein [Gammaproteobacteria bacterium]